jgi:hypothetical protein
LVFLAGLTIGDYLLWSWSLDHNQTVLALVSGLTLPPLALMSVWLLALGCGRLIAHLARGRGRRARHTGGLVTQNAGAAGDGRRSLDDPTANVPTDAPARKLAA